MKATKLLLPTILASLIITKAWSQSTTASNVSIVPAQFLGYNGVGLSKPLEIRNNFNQPINFFTNAVQRARMFNGPLGGFAINSFGNTQITPGSLLSIGVDRTGYSGWRSWMYEGMSVQANSDNMYVGLKYEGASNHSDAVIV